MRKLGITSLYILSILEKNPGETYVDFIDQKLAIVTKRKKMPLGQTNVALQRMRASKMVVKRMIKHVGGRGRPRTYYDLTPKGRETLESVRAFIS